MKNIQFKNENDGVKMSIKIGGDLTLDELIDKLEYINKCETVSVHEDIIAVLEEYELYVDIEYYNYYLLRTLLNENKSINLIVDILEAVLKHSYNDFIYAELSRTIKKVLEVVKNDKEYSFIYKKYMNISAELLSKNVSINTLKVSLKEKDFKAVLINRLNEESNDIRKMNIACIIKEIDIESCDMFFDVVYS